MPASIYWSLPAWLAPDRIQERWWGLDIVTRPVDEPIGLGDAKRYCRVEQSYTDDDAEIAGLLVVARRYCEKRTNRSLLPTTWDFWLQTWPLDRIFLPRAPLRSVTWLKYTNISEQQIAVDPSIYDVCLTGDPGSIVRQFGQIWPADPLSPSRPITARFQAGYDYFSGVVTVGSNGLDLTRTSGDNLDPTWGAGTMITLDGSSCPLASVTDGSTAKLASPAAAGAGVSYTLNLVPDEIKLAMRMLITHWYQNREPIVVGRGVTSTEVAKTVDSLLNSYRTNVMGFAQTRAQAEPLWI